jgi:hypothetical protein
LKLGFFRALRGEQKAQAPDGKRQDEEDHGERPFSHPFLLPKSVLSKLTSGLFFFIYKSSAVKFLSGNPITNDPANPRRSAHHRRRADAQV